MPTLISPLRYPGGKSKSFKYFASMFPDEVEEYRDPFVGGGSVAFVIAQLHPQASIWINDLYHPLYCFYKTIQSEHGCDAFLTDVRRLREEADTVEKAKGIFMECRRLHGAAGVSDHDRAVAFYIGNRCSFSGLGDSGSFSAQASTKRWTTKRMEDIPEFSRIMRDWKITNDDYATVLAAPWSSDKSFLFADPPYDIKHSTLYGLKGGTHKGFDHVQFAEDAGKVAGRMMITYNDSEDIRALFPGWEAHRLAWQYSMLSSKSYREQQEKRFELVLLNYPTAGAPAVEPDDLISFPDPEAGTAPLALLG